MKQKILSLLFLLLSFSVISQENIWTNRIEFQVTSSFIKSDNSLRNVLWSFDGPRYHLSTHFALGWNTSIQLNKNIFLESGLSLIRRKNENADIFNQCFFYLENEQCGEVLYVNTDKRHLLINIPLRIRLQKNIAEKLTAYWSGSLNNYLHLSTSYKGSNYKTKVNYKNYHGYSINTAIGVRYPLTRKFTIDAEINSRLYEKSRQAEILHGDPKNFDTYSFENMNLMLSLNYFF